VDSCRLWEEGYEATGKERIAAGYGKRDMRQKEGEDSCRLWEEGYEAKGRNGMLRAGHGQGELLALRSGTVFRVVNMPQKGGGSHKLH